jgi:hypothetical protein
LDTSPQSSLDVPSPSAAAQLASPTASTLSIQDISRAAVKIASEDFAKKEQELLKQV